MYNDQKRSYFSKNDLILVISLLGISLIVFVFIFAFQSRTDILIANIYFNNEIIKSYNLKETKNCEIEIKDGIIIEINEHKIRFLKSKCKDKICVRLGFINKQGQTSVCLPENVMIKIENSKGKLSDKQKIDAII